MLSNEVEILCIKVGGREKVGIPQGKVHIHIHDTMVGSYDSGLGCR
jgi:hypothetical protein